jgi:hypothetical protein
MIKEILVCDNCGKYSAVNHWIFFKRDSQTFCILKSESTNVACSIQCLLALIYEWLGDHTSFLNKSQE